MQEYKKNKTNPFYSGLSPLVSGLFYQNEPILAGSWKLAAGSYFHKTNPFSPFFNRKSTSPKSVYLYSCIPAYLFRQNEPNFRVAEASSFGLTSIASGDSLILIFAL
jgi:hypothetical protein